jgi:hypothetical protein
MRKITRAHSTYIEAAEMLLNYLNNEPLVKKIVLGRIAIKYRSSKSITPVKINTEKGCLLLKINSKNSNQEIRVYSENIDDLKKKLEKFIKTNAS